MAQWNIGFAKRLINPPPGVPLAGYGLLPQRTSEAILDDLYVRCVVLENGGARAAILAVDLIGLSSDFCDPLRAGAARHSNIPANAVVCVATHSHSTPAGAFFRHWGAIDPVYLRSVHAQADGAIKDAVKALVPCEIGFAETQVPGIAMNRVRKDGPVDHTLRVFAARDRQSKKPLVAMTNFSCHPVHFQSDSRFVSSEYCGRLVRDLERQFSGMSALFLQGHIGDINPERTHAGSDAAGEHGRKLADAAAGLLEGIAYSADGDLKHAVIDCHLPLNYEDAKREALEYLCNAKVRARHEMLAYTGFLREWATETLGIVANNPPPALRVQLPALQIGGTALLGLPGEIFTALGQRIRTVSPYKNTWITGFTNASVGYISTPDAFDESMETIAAGGGPYAAILAPKIMGLPPYATNVGDALVDSSLQLLKKLAG